MRVPSSGPGPVLPGTTHPVPGVASRPRFRRRVAPPLLALAALAAAAAGCSSTSADGAIEVLGSNTACTPRSTDIAAGKRTFTFRNNADDVNELYVTTTDGETVGEVENVTTGTSRTLSVNLKAGTYKLICKPGMKGKGISTTITVTGAGGQSAAPDRTVEITAHDYRYGNVDGTLVAGQRVKFELENEGTVQHEMEVRGPDGKVIGEVGPTDAGKSGSVVLDLAKAGTYQFVCGIADHRQKGMTATFDVAAVAASAG